MTEKDTPAYIREQRTAGLFAEKHWVKTDKGKEFLKEEIENNEHVKGLVKFAEGTNSGVESLHHIIEEIQQTSNEKISQLQQYMSTTKKTSDEQISQLLNDMYIINQHLTALSHKNDGAWLYGAPVFMSFSKLKTIGESGVVLSPDSIIGKEMFDCACRQITTWCDSAQGHYEWLSANDGNLFAGMGLTWEQATLVDIHDRYVYNHKICTAILHRIRSSFPYLYDLDVKKDNMDDMQKKHHKKFTTLFKWFIGQTDAQSNSTRRMLEKTMREAQEEYEFMQEEHENIHHMYSDEEEFESHNSHAKARHTTKKITRKKVRPTRFKLTTAHTPSKTADLFV